MKNPEAVSLGKKRWAGKTAEEKREHIMKMVEAGKKAREAKKKPTLS